MPFVKGLTLNLSRVDGLWGLGAGLIRLRNAVTGWGASHPGPLKPP